MNDKGYIRLHRKIWENDVLFCGERFTRLDAWIWLITHASHKPRILTIRGRTYSIQRGQYFTSIRYLASVWRWDKDTVSRFLSDTETEKMTTITRTQVGTLITVLNYNKYQGSGGRISVNTDTEPDTESDAESPTRPDAESPLINNVINNVEKKSKEERRGRRVIE